MKIYTYPLYKENMIIKYFLVGIKKFVNNIKNRKNPWSSENNASDNQTEASTPQTTPSLDESLINQQTTPAKIDNNKKKPEDTKDSLTSESTTSSTETQENVSLTVSIAVDKLT